MRRLNILVILLLGVVAIQCGSGSTTNILPTPIPPSPTLTTELGGGYNENLYNIDNGLIFKSGVSWVRGFVNIPRNFLEFDDLCTDSCPVIGVLGGNISQGTDADSGNSEVLAISSNGFQRVLQHQSPRVSGF